jgi:hypothetical protein
MNDGRMDDGLMDDGRMMDEVPDGAAGVALEDRARIFGLGGHGFFPIPEAAPFGGDHEAEFVGELIGERMALADVEAQEIRVRLFA